MVSKLKAVLILFAWWLIRPDGFKIGVLVCLAIAFTYVSPSGKRLHQGLNTLDRRLNDVMFFWRGGSKTSGRCVIVDLDERSLKKIGQWPWPRTTIARLLQKINEDEPAVIGLDIVFAEADRLSPKRFAKMMEQELGLEISLPAKIQDTDVILGEALADLPVILGYLFILENDGILPPANPPFFMAGISPLPPANVLTRAYRPIMNIPSIGENALSEGFFNALNDSDAVVREVPLFIEYDKRPYPGLALEMFRHSIDCDSYQPVFGKNGMFGVKVGDHFIPTTSDGKATLNWRSSTRAFQYVSASDVLMNRVSKETFKDKYVLIGTSAGGLHDLRSSPLCPTLPGVEFHATLIDNILQNDLFRRDLVEERGIMFGGFLLAGILLSAIVAYCPSTIGILSGFLALFGTVIFNYHFFFLNGKLVGIAFPLFALTFLILVILAANYFFEGRQKQYIRDAFAHYVSGRVVNQIVKDSKHLSLAGEERNMSIMFSDIRNFTSLSEGFDAAGLSSLLNEYLGAMTEILLAHDGTLDKFIGDAVMAFWNAPADQPEHATAAIQCALEMQRKLAELRSLWKPRGLPEMRIGIGIATGSASVGNMGCVQRFNYTVMGDTVNLSSRLEGLTKNYGAEILVSEPTLEAANWKSRSRYVDLVRVKGRKQPLRIYEPLARADSPEEEQLWKQTAAAYLDSDFAKAQTGIDELKKRFPRPLYDLYAERLETFATQPPDDDWDGVFTHTTK